MPKKPTEIFQKVPRNEMWRYIIMSVIYEGPNTLEYISQKYLLEDEKAITISELEKLANQLQKKGLIMREEKTKEYFLTRPGRDYFELNHHQNQY